MKLKTIRCPKCGEPARSALMVLKVRVPVIFNYDVTRNPDKADYHLDFSNIFKAHRSVKQPIDSVELTCGGEHVWTSALIGPDEEEDE